MGKMCSASKKATISAVRASKWRLQLIIGAWVHRPENNLRNVESDFCRIELFPDMGQTSAIEARLMHGLARDIALGEVEKNLSSRQIVHNEVQARGILRVYW